MKDKFDKQELKDTILAFRDYVHRQSYDLEMSRIEDLDMLDKVEDYLVELLENYN